MQLLHLCLWRNAGAALVLVERCRCCALPQINWRPSSCLLLCWIGKYSFQQYTYYVTHDSRLPACLTLWILTPCLSILFWSSACEYAGSRAFAFVGAIEIWSL